MPFYSDTSETIPEFGGEDIVDVLLRGKRVALVGAPGTGKSTELNAILLPLFRSLLDPQSPLKDLFHRADDELYRYREQDGEITSSIVAGAGATMSTLGAYFEHLEDTGFFALEKPPHKDVVLLLEMAEHEINPTCTHIATVLALPSSVVRDKVRSFRKTFGVDFAARPPHTETELAVLVAALYHGDDQAALCTNMGLPVNASLQAVLRETQERIDAVGPLARVVLGSRAVYSDWWRTLVDTANVREFLNLRQSVSFYNLPGTSKYYVAPIGAYCNYYEKFLVLGRLAKQLILREAKAKHLDEMIIRYHKVEGQLGEAVLLDHYLLGKGNPRAAKHLPFAWDHRNWEYFRNPGPERALERTHGLDSKTVKALRAEHMQRAGITYFLPSTLPGCMDPDRVYISTAHTAAVAEAATISKDRALLTLFQIGARHSGERDYSLFIKSLRQWVRAVKPKQLHVVYFTNWASKNTCGFGVKGYKDDNAVSRKLFDGQKGMFSSYIVRGGIYRDVPEVVLVGHKGRYSSMLAQYTTAEERGQTDRFERRLSAYTKQRLMGLAEAGGKALEVSDRKHALVQSLLSLLRDRSFRARAAGTDRLTP